MVESTGNPGGSTPKTIEYPQHGGYNFFLQATFTKVQKNNIYIHRNAINL